MNRPPKGAADAVRRLSPLTLYGTPRYRLVWSKDPKTWVCGWFNVFDNSGNLVGGRFERKEIDKYSFNPPCWILEIWEPPEYFGTPEKWLQQTQGTEKGQWYHEIGPYPHEGDYRYLLKFTHKITHEPIEPTEKLIEFLFKERIKQMTKGDLAKERTAKQEAKDKERKANVAEVIGEEPFGGRPNNLNPQNFLRIIREDRILKENAL